MLMKIATHVVVFGLGAAGGIYWGVNHPQQAQVIHDTEQQDAAKVKAAIVQTQQQVLQKTGTDQSATNLGTAVNNTVDKAIQTGKQDLDAAKAKIGN